MPPQRTAPPSGQRPSPLARAGPSKPIKSERTHEENQERAYIAASRRSDRSLEARVESARRASEIHKRRTGRGLRVTEQDVMNEEMYEEEDDDYTLLNRQNHYNNLIGMGMGIPLGFPNNFQDKLRAYFQHQIQMAVWANSELEKRGYPTQSHAGYRPNVFAHPQALANPMMQMPYGYFPQYPQAPFASPMYGMSPQMMPQVSYVQNPAQSQGRNMSMHTPQNGMATRTSPMAPTVAIHRTASPPTPAQQNQPIVIPSRSPSIAAPTQRLSPLATHTSSINSYPSPRSAGSASTSPVATTNTEPTPTRAADFDMFPFRTDLAPESARLLEGHMQHHDTNEFTDFLSFNTGEYSDKSHVSPMLSMNEGQTIIKGEQFPLTPSTGTPGWHTKLEVPTSHSPVSNQLLSATSPQDSPFSDASILPPGSSADDGFNFTNDGNFLDDNLFSTQNWDWPTET